MMEYASVALLHTKFATKGTVSPVSLYYTPMFLLLFSKSIYVDQRKDKEQERP